MAELTAAGLKFCIALMGVAPASERQCIMAWFRAWEAKGTICASPFEPWRGCSYIGSEDFPNRNPEAYECIHFSNLRRQDGTIAKIVKCDLIMKPKDDGPPVS